ncbi:hypothetical protein Srot_1895 [Segniliparus rotundus DSM 44985]|uniref:Uncharacterized protein n=1 Tax=Segniliparus rotundus (strain ATCC BAA-972 / CDC 1076 / CIP 108378 / DSM 44985 / JCM 13578) TaxID=640132 RepID=D6Z8S5_SEGRD|nr:hypothetical protein [Segniliparus rotundus]ADG98355.1 hypothetical protein Srot_1895 [Segniliparus rotundus DSM 44985]
MAKTKKVLPWVFGIAIGILISILAIGAFTWYSFEQSAKPDHDAARAEELAKKYGGIVLPSSATVVQATTREDFQGGQDSVIITRIPQQDVEAFAKNSKIESWTSAAPSSVDADCTGMAHSWEGYVMTNKNGGKCLLDHAFNGYSERKLALQPQPDGTALVFIAVANP